MRWPDLIISIVWLLYTGQTNFVIKGKNATWAPQGVFLKSLEAPRGPQRRNHDFDQNRKNHHFDQNGKITILIKIKKSRFWSKSTNRDFDQNEIFSIWSERPQGLSDGSSGFTQLRFCSEQWFPLCPQGKLIIWAKPFWPSERPWRLLPGPSSDSRFSWKLPKSKKTILIKIEKNQFLPRCRKLTSRQPEKSILTKIDFFWFSPKSSNVDFYQNRPWTILAKIDIYMFSSQIHYHWIHD